MTVPVWVWAVTAAGLAATIAAEVAAGRRSARSGASGAGSARRAIGWVGVYVSLAVLFGLALGVTTGWVTAGQFYTGYLTEYSLSLDNLFVFSVIMTWFAVSPARQPRILLFGIGLALVLRSALIVAGAAALNHFGWLFYPLGVVLVWTAIGLIRGSGDGPDSEPERHARLATWLRRRLQRSGPQGTTPVLLLAVAIGLADLLFAFDSAARSLIQVADADGNGVLDPGEYARLAAVYGARADQAERAFGRLDQDRDGVLDATELTLAISQFFASRDPGGYGNVVFGHL